MTAFDHSQYVDRLPLTLYGRDAQARTLIRLMADRRNAQEAVMLQWIDPANLSGIGLDRLGRMLGIERGELSDDELRNTIDTTPFAFYERISIPNLTALLAAFTDQPWIEELCEDQPSGRFFWDGSRYMDGKEPMHPAIRDATFKAHLAVGLGVDFGLIRRTVDNAKGNGIGVYIHYDIVAALADFGAVDMPDEIELKFQGDPVASLPYSSEIRITETTCPAFDEIALLLSSAEIGSAAIKTIEPDFRSTYSLFIS